MTNTNYTRDGKPISYEVRDDGYMVYLDGTPWIHQYEPYIPHPELGYEGSCLKQLDDLFGEKILTEEEKLTAYNELTTKYIHERYTLDDENKIMREYISDMTNETYKVAFDAYNAYVEECKTKAHIEIYGE